MRASIGKWLLTAGMAVTLGCAPTAPTLAAKANAGHVAKAAARRMEIDFFKAFSLPSEPVQYTANSDPSMINLKRYDRTRPICSFSAPGPPSS